MPYTENLDVALWAIDNDLRYCDLGGSVSFSRSIKAMAQKANKPIMTDLGLAPGWVNLLGEEVYAQLPEADTVTMMVGGIPRVRVKADPLNYMLTWSLDGLLNEYVDRCEIIDNGEIKTVSGLDGLEDLVVDGLELEAFYTSGGSAHSILVMHARGVKNCYYKTLRWRGHCELMNFIISASKDSRAIEDLLRKSSEYHRQDMRDNERSCQKRGGVRIKEERSCVSNPTIYSNAKSHSFSSGFNLQMLWLRDTWMN